MKEIDIFIFEYDNLSEEERKNQFNKIKEYLNSLDLYKILDCCFKYSSSKYLKGKNKEILDLLKEILNNKLESLSLIKVIDLYIELFNKTLVVSDALMASKNILDVMSYNISDNEYIEKELTKKNISKEEYINSLKKDLDKSLLVIDEYNKTYNYLDNLQDDILIYIESSLTKIENQDKYYLIQNINKRFSDFSLKLLKLKNNLEDVKNLDKNELLNTIEYNNLKNRLIIYESFRNSLLKENKDDNQ